jgi:hypothetical protein
MNPLDAAWSMLKGDPSTGFPDSYGGVQNPQMQPRVIYGPTPQEADKKEQERLLAQEAHERRQGNVNLPSRFMPRSIPPWSHPYWSYLYAQGGQQ